MNMKSDILYGVLLFLVSGVVFSACQQQDLIEGVTYDKDTLIAQGRYLTARSVDAFALSDINEGPQPFDVGTPYRLLAFTKPYDAAGPTEENPVAQYPRFNKVAWEGETSGKLRFINIDSEPDRWFGFSALGKEERGDDDLVSLDFYGFTYGVAEEYTPDYIPVDGWSDETTRLADLKHTESVTGGELKDLMRGVLLNQNISTAGIKDTAADGNQIADNNTQSVIPFNHCFSKLRFQISQQDKEGAKDAAGNPLPYFENLVVEKIEVTGTYETGTVALADGKVSVSGKIDRTLKFNDKFDGKVTVNNSDVGEMIVFPSDGSALGNMADGYAVGLRITVKSTVREYIENMLGNTGSPGGITEETDADGVTTWYKGTIVKDEIIDYYTDVTAPDRILYFRQNTSYMLIIAFKKDSVRIITVIPMVEEWLPGEVTPEGPWQDQPMGQPQMFDNIVWSDRNIGADHYDPTGSDFEKCVGYFYQAGRNIPYYPFKYKEYSGGAKPDINDKNKQDLANSSSSYGISKYRFYPVVDSSILNMTGSEEWTMYNDQGNPQMMIPETKPADDYYFNFSRGKDNSNQIGLNSAQDMHWDKGQSKQPLSGVWKIPSSREYLTIFPSTPHAGNITFRKGWYNSDAMGWKGDAMTGAGAPDVLRVTVPYYYDGMKSPARGGNAKYTEAWNRLESNKDPGCTSEGYSIGPGDYGNPNYEPDGDPEDGYASVYIISRAGDDLVAPDILKGTDSQGKDWVIKSWGTIYAIKRIYTTEAYRMRWRVINAAKSAINPCLYIEICRYRCKPDARLTVDNYKDYDWEHPAATIYFPICGLGDWTGEYINFGTECEYATSDKIENGKTSAVQIKITGNDAYNAYIAVVRGVINRTFGMQIRPIRREANDDI